MMQVRTKTEYRINKKGAECFRTEDGDLAVKRLAELNAKRPVYTLQVRRLRYGGYIDRPTWTPWL